MGQGFRADTNQSLRIGELASRAAISVDAIRFYEKCGLLPQAQRSTGHFRMYRPRDLERVRFIRQMQALGFSLREIRELVVLRDRKTESCETVKKLLQEKLASTRTKARQLKQLEAELLADLHKCNEELRHRRKHKPCPCPVLEEAEKCKSKCFMSQGAQTISLQ